MIRKEDLLNKFLSYCHNLDENSVLVVEGRKDIQALQFLQIHCQIESLAGQSLDKVVDKVYSFDNIVILTDFDRKGKQLRNKIKKEIQSRKGHGRIDSLPRQLLYQFFRANRITVIEDLENLLIGKGWRNKIDLKELQ